MGGVQCCVVVVEQHLTWSWLVCVSGTWYSDVRGLGGGNLIRLWKCCGLESGKSWTNVQ